MLTVFIRHVSIFCCIIVGVGENGVGIGDSGVVSIAGDGVVVLILLVMVEMVLMVVEVVVLVL